VCLFRDATDEFKRFSSALTLSIALAANIGGTATLIGCGPNVALAGITERSRYSFFIIGSAAEMAATIYRPFRVIYDYADEPGDLSNKWPPIPLFSRPLWSTLDFSNRKCYTCNWRYFHQILSIFDLPAWSYGPKLDRRTDWRTDMRKYDPIEIGRITISLTRRAHIRTIYPIERKFVTPGFNRQLYSS